MDAEAAKYIETPNARAMGREKNIIAIDKFKREFSVEVALNPISTLEGTKILAAVVDITERKLAQQAILDRQEQIRLMIDSIHDYAIIRLDVNGIVVSWSAAAERLKGFKEDEIIGQSFAQFYPKQERDLKLPEKNLEFAIKNNRFESEGLRMRANGSTFLANVIINSIRDSRI